MGVGVGLGVGVGVAWQLARQVAKSEYCVENTSFVRKQEPSLQSYPHEFGDGENGGVGVGDGMGQLKDTISFSVTLISVSCGQHFTTNPPITVAWYVGSQNNSFRLQLQDKGGF